MRKVVNGILCNTETARRLAGIWNGEIDKRKKVEEDLYRTRSGVYFLHGKGGSETKYAIRDGSQYKAGEEILVLTEGEAKNWVHEYAPPNYEEIFREVLPELKSETLSIRCSKNLADHFKAVATSRGWTYSEALAYLVDLEYGKLPF